MQERHNDRSRYFEEQAITCEKFYLPYIKYYVAAQLENVLEVGCGEGGNLMPFAKEGKKVMGVDYSTTRINQARQFFEERGLEGTFINSDIFALKEYHNQFQLIIVHDVIEHIGDKETFLKNMRAYFSADGIMFIAFPAWMMPFGGHQQISRGKAASHLPFFHILPKSIYKGILKMFGEKDDVIKELLSIKDTRCTIENFKKIVNRTGYEILNQQLYFINPNYQTKFGLKPRKLYKWLSHVPYIRDYFSTSCFFLIKPKK